MMEISDEEDWTLLVVRYIALFQQPDCSVALALLSSLRPSELIEQSPVQRPSKDHTFQAYAPGIWKSRSSYF